MTQTEAEIKSKSHQDGSLVRKMSRQEAALTSSLCARVRVCVCACTVKSYFLFPTQCWHYTTGRREHEAGTHTPRHTHTQHPQVQRFSSYLEKHKRRLTVNEQAQTSSRNIHLTSYSRIYKWAQHNHDKQNSYTDQA